MKHIKNVRIPSDYEDDKYWKEYLNNIWYYHIGDPKHDVNTVKEMKDAGFIGLYLDDK